MTLVELARMNGETYHFRGTTYDALPIAESVAYAIRARRTCHVQDADGVNVWFANPNGVCGTLTQSISR